MDINYLIPPGTGSLYSTCTACSGLYEEGRLGMGCPRSGDVLF